MAIFRAPLRDIRFVLHDLLDVSELSALPGYEEATPELLDAVIAEAGRLCEDVLFPLNRSGDEEGCRLEDGVVRTPAGFREAYETFAKGGWCGLSADPAHGGQGLPKTLAIVVQELICAANLSFGTYPFLSQAAYEAIAAHGDERLKAIYLPHLASGHFSGTMCLTEAQCGTDLGLIRTRAEPLADGSFAISGTKIFISAGEHDLSENIVHLVLARLPDAPAGIRGISLFLVPKLLVDERGRTGGRNAVTCVALEAKMGIKASSTCQLTFEGAVGWLVGEPNRGLGCMFTMMNRARLAVGIQGLGLAETAYQSAAAYARERLQGRSPAGPRHPDRPADPILVHPDMRRLLLSMRAFAEGARALAYWVAIALDHAERDPDAERRAAAEDLVALLTPVIKAHFTDLGFEATNTGQQVLGGHGYIREHGMEQLVRDARIAQIYEGTNAIQALDLVGRKLPTGYGRALRQFFHPVAAFLETHGSDPGLADIVPPLAKAFGRLQRATLTIAERGRADPEEAAAAASDYLSLFGIVALGFMWARMAAVAKARLDAGDAEDPAFYQAKLETARFYAARVLPRAGAQLALALAGKQTLMALDEAAF